VLLLAVALIVGQSPSSAADLAWLTGCWELTRNGRHIVEQWTAPEGGTLIGVSRTVAAGKTTEYEFVLIREGTNGLEYVAKPSGQSEATFTVVRAMADEVVFENREHDFPNRIIYKRDGDRLVAAIEGTRDGKTQRIEYPYQPAACGRVLNTR
jgi:hypothetical protein